MIVVGLCVIGAEAIATIGAHGLLGDALFALAGLMFASFGTLLRRWRVPPMRATVAVSVLSMAVLPFALLAGGLTMTSATDVVIFAIACMALNLLVGQTGLVSFGHGAWFGIGAYAAALAQLHWFRGSMLWPTLFALAVLFAASLAVDRLMIDTYLPVTKKDDSGGGTQGASSSGGTAGGQPPVNAPLAALARRA